MAKYLIRRLLAAMPTLLVISFVVFGVLALSPGDPLAEFALNPNVPPEVRDLMRKSLGLDEPFLTRYVKWVSSMVQGDWGYSFTSRSPVFDMIKQRLPNTLWVVGLAYLVSVVVALPLGIISAVRQYSLFDQAVSTFAFLGYAIPTFFSGLLAILLFSITLHWLPFIYDSTVRVTDLPSLWVQIKQIILPVGVVALSEMAGLTRFTRSSVLDNLPLDYVRTARAKGLREKAVILRHVVRNSLIPVITLVALGIPGIFTGAIITEQIFRVPGIGELLVRSITNSDTPVIMAITFVYAALVVVFNLIADILYGIADPRIRYD